MGATIAPQPMQPLHPTGATIAPDSEVDSENDSKGDSKHHACGALKIWLHVKAQIREELPPEEYRLWVEQARLTCVMSGNQLLIALPPNNEIIAAARGRKHMLNYFLREHGFNDHSLTTYPDAHQMERLRTEYPEFYAQFFPAMRQAYEERDRRGVLKQQATALENGRKQP